MYKLKNIRKKYIVYLKGMNYIFDFNNKNNLDKHIIDKLRVDELEYLINCYKRYNETNNENKTNIKYIINHTYLFLLDNNDDHVFLKYIQSDFDIFYNFMIFFNIHADNIKKDIFHKFLYTSINNEHLYDHIKILILMENKDFLNYIINYEKIKNISVKTIITTILGKIIFTSNNTTIEHYIGILKEYESGKKYLISWFNLFYKLYHTLLVNIHTETLLDIDIFHRLKKVFLIIEDLWFDIESPRVINSELFFSDENFLGFTQYDSPIVSSYDKNVSQIVPDTYQNRLLLTYHRYNEMLTLLHLSKYITLNENKNEYIGNDNVYSNINIIINFLSSELFFSRVYDTFKFYDRIINIIFYTWENHPENYKCLPDSFIRSIFDLVLYVDKCDKWSHFKLSDFQIFLPNIARLCYLFIEEDKSISNPHIRVNALGLLDLLSINDVYIEPKIINGLLDFYIKLETFQTADSFYDKFRHRKYIFNIEFNFINENFKEYYISVIKSMDKIKLTRIFYLLFNDFNFIIEDLFQKINDKHVYIDFQTHTDSELSLLHKYQTFLCMNIEFCNIDSILLDNYILTKFVQSLNYNINLIMKTNYNFIKDNHKVVQLFYSLLGIYEHFRNNEVFLDVLIKDIRTFSIKFIKDIKLLFINLCHIEHFPSVLDINIVNDIVDKVIKYTKRIEYPDENKDHLLDPITFEPIKCPVILPSSGVVMDKWTICNHLLSNESDPFNREKLTITELENYNMTEIAKEKIKQFKDSNINN